MKISCWVVRAVGAVAVTAAALGACASEGAQADREPTVSPALMRELQDLQAQNPTASIDEMGRESWVDRLPRHRLQMPLDAAYQFGASALYFPAFLPELHPEKNLDEMCGEQFYTSPWLVQRQSVNPFVALREQFELLDADEDERYERFLLGAAYAYLHRDFDEWASDTALAMLKRPEYLTGEIAVDTLAPWVESYLPEMLTTVSAPEKQVPVDVRVFSNVSYDSAASLERTLSMAADRGIKAVAIADRSEIAGGQKAENVAERLKREGRIAKDFLVIPSQVVYSHTGSILSLFTGERISDGMTMERTIDCIHDAGGLAYLVHPGVPGGPERLAKLDFDGWLMQPSMFEMFRMLSIMNSPAYADRPALAASSSRYSGIAGLPYSLVEAEEVSLEAIKRGLRERRVYAAGDLYLPWMTAASWPPVSHVNRFLNRYFGPHAYAETRVARALGVDSVILSTSWDAEIRSMMGIAGMIGGVVDLIDGSSPLFDAPELGYIAAEFSYFRIGYDNPSDTAFIQARICW